MPFDVALETLLARRQRLIYALTYSLPKGHQWDFGGYLEHRGCVTVGCAVGVAHLIWPDAGLIEHGDANESALMAWFGLSQADIDRVFFWHEESIRKADWSTVTPQMVSDALSAAPLISDNMEYGG